MHCEHRKNQEEAQHAQPEHAGEARAGAKLDRAHAFRGQEWMSAEKRNGL
jgi:hypothetical protein